MAESSKQTNIPKRLNLQADRQFLDSRRNVTVAEGNVSVQIGSSLLQADRVDFDIGFKTLFARGAVRVSRGAQSFQASSLRYNLALQEGELDDVYGVIDLGGDVPSDPGGSAPAEPEPLACPPLLPPVPDWHPHPWSVTAWGGQMIDAAFGDSEASPA